MSSERRASTVGELVATLEERYPRAWAEAWDQVGLVVGDPGAPMTGVLVTLDATAEAVQRAAAASANVLVTHHPPSLTVPERVVAAPGPAGTLEAALRLQVAVISLHTNLDRSPAGGSALAERLGLTILSPLESALEQVALIVTYAPENAIPAIKAAMALAGAGRLGEYAGCSFISEGTGSFRPLAGALPAVVDDGVGVPELRLEMVAPCASIEAVLKAARGAHPYEEPVVIALEGVRARGAARLGRVCSWIEGATLGDLAAHVSRTLGCSCRVWGGEERSVRRIAVANGSGGSLVADAQAAADTMIVGEVRYHDALAAVAAGLAVIEAGHDSTEWPLVSILGDAVRASVAPTIEVIEESATAGWWTMEDADVRR